MQYAAQPAGTTAAQALVNSGADPQSLHNRNQTVHTLHDMYRLGELMYQKVNMVVMVCCS